MKSEVETHLGLARSETRLEFRHPRGIYRVVLENNATPSERAASLLAAYVIFDAEDMDGARDVGRDHLRGFCDTLTLVTGLRLKPGRDLCLYDWSATSGRHHGYVFNAIPELGAPFAMLDGALLASAATLLEKDRTPAVSRALRWFANGVNSGPPDDQFAWFWLAVEVLAQQSKDVAPIPDSCPQCRGPLYCKECQRTPTHRPYTSQAIRQLIAKHAEGEPEKLFEDVSAFRNALMHGDLLRRVEAERGMTIGDLVDELASVAWRGLMEQLVPFSEKRAEVALRLLIPSTYLNHEVTLRAHCSFDRARDGEPDLREVPCVSVDLVSRPIASGEEDVYP